MNEVLSEKMKLFETAETVSNKQKISDLWDLKTELKFPNLVLRIEKDLWIFSWQLTPRLV